MKDFYIFVGLLFFFLSCNSCRPTTTPNRMLVRPLKAPLEDPFPADSIFQIPDPIQ